MNNHEAQKAFALFKKASEDDLPVIGEHNGATKDVTSILLDAGTYCFAFSTGYKTGRYRPAREWENVRLAGRGE